MQSRSVVCTPSLPTPSSIDTPAMDIGLAIALRNLPGQPSDLPQLYQDFLTEVELAEELGFSHAWISEHHFAEDDWNSAPLPLLAAAAARTQRWDGAQWVELPDERVSLMELLANARAQRDDLLEAARKALDLLAKGAPGWGVAKDILRTAISKAEGA